MKRSARERGGWPIGGQQAGQGARLTSLTVRVGKQICLPLLVKRTVDGEDSMYLELVADNYAPLA